MRTRSGDHSFGGVPMDRGLSNVGYGTKKVIKMCVGLSHDIPDAVLVNRLEVSEDEKTILMDIIIDQNICRGIVVMDTMSDDGA